MAESSKKTQPRKRGISKKAPSGGELKLCTAYLYRKDSCSRGDECDFLHVCRNYILESCRAGRACKFSHDLSCKQPQAMFRRRFGIEHLNGQSLHEFRELFAATLRNPPKGGSDQDEVGDGDVEPRRKLMSFLQSFNQSEEATPQDDTRPHPGPGRDQCPKICSFYVDGICKFTSHRGFRHCSSPYQWQIRDSRHGNWLDLTRQANDWVEERFCDVKCVEFSGAIVSLSGDLDSVFYKVRITFGVESFTIVSNDKYDRNVAVRRLSTVSDAQPGCPRNGHRTRWIWYWQDGSQNWIEFPKSNDSSSWTSSFTIEKNYLSFKNKKGSAQLEVTMTDLGMCQIDFSKMELCQDCSYPLARRPMWKPPSDQGLPNDQSSQGDSVNSQSLNLTPDKEQKEPATPKKSKARPRRGSRGGSQDAKAEKRLPKVSQPSSSEQEQLSKVLESGEQLASFLKSHASELLNHDVPKIEKTSQEPHETAQVVKPVEPHVEQPSSQEPEESVQAVRPKSRNSSGPTKTLTATDNQASRRPNQKEFTYICPYFLRGNCIYQDDKYNHKRHFPNPYQWQFLDTTVKGADWLDFPTDENHRVERSFCDVKSSTYEGSSGQPSTMHVFFQATHMHGSTVDTHVRRLSTSSSVLKSNWEIAFCTEWVWYWKDETGTWIVYSEQSAKGTQAGIDSATIEQKFLDYESKRGEPVIEFRAGTQRYRLDFTAMQQTNVQYRTCRDVRRRPKFVVLDERKKFAKELSKAEKGGIVVPRTWENRGAQRETKLVELTDCTNPEYTNIANLFWDTMDDKGTLVSIQRIQNLELWEDFTKMGERMKKRNGNKEVLTKQLFHGTPKEYVNAIYCQNFDWRLSGSRVGTRYGKGSYFARDAVFAHSYTNPDNFNQRYMFVAKVLVGSYTTGRSEYARPPSKDPRKPLEDLYDSCVNDIQDPTIYVIFEKTQVYPEYLITYTEKTGYQSGSSGIKNPYATSGSKTRNPYATSSSSTQNPYATSGSRTQNSYAASSSTSQNPYATSSSRTQNPYATSGSRTQNPYAASSSTSQNPYATSSSRTQNPYATPSPTPQYPHATSSSRTQSSSSRSHQPQPKQESKCIVQ